MDLKKLIPDLNAARVVADAAIKNVADRGTCNFDRLTFTFKRAPAEKKRETLLKAVTDVGFHAYWGTWFGKKVLFIAKGGQGFRRTLWAESMDKTLKGLGWDTTVYYQMD